MSDKDLDAISDDLLCEFKRLGKDFPHITKMFMDMVAIIAEHNDQIHSISNAMQEVVTEVAKLREMRINSSFPEFGNSDSISIFDNFKPPKKEDLN